jgi:hypothetical protein
MFDLLTWKAPIISYRLSSVEWALSDLIVNCVKGKQWPSDIASGHRQTFSPRRRSSLNHQYHPSKYPNSYLLPHAFRLCVPEFDDRVLCSCTLSLTTGSMATCALDSAALFFSACHIVLSLPQSSMAMLQSFFDLEFSLGCLIYFATADSFLFY